MANMIRANRVRYDQKSSTFVQGRIVVINLDHVVKFEPVFAAEPSKVDISLLGKILFEIDTVNENAAFPLTVVSEELENLYRGVKL